MKKIVKPYKARKTSASTDVPSFARGKDQILKSPARLQRRKKNELGEFDDGKNDLNQQSVAFLERYNMPDDSFINMLNPKGRYGSWRMTNGDVVTGTAFKQGGKVYVQTNDNNIVEVDDSDNVIYPKRQQYASSFDGSYSNFYDTLDAMTGGTIGMMPVLGDILDIGKVGSDLYNKQYASAALGASLLALPNFIEKPLKQVKPFKKKLNRLFTKYGRMYFSPDQLAYKMSFEEIPISRTAKDKFLQTYRENTMPSINRPDMENIITSRYGKDGYRLMKDNPQYADFVLHNKLDPRLQSTVDQFLDQQRTSLRGVYAKNDQIANEALTLHGNEVPRSGGDMLHTHGGLYSSNSPSIADKFKNPPSGSSNGYVGVIKSKINIDRNKPIAEQLNDYRNQILNLDASGLSHVLSTDGYQQLLKDKGYKFVEQTYGGGDVIQRASIPDKNVPVSQIADISGIKRYDNQVNAGGRWGYGQQSVDPDNLFTRHKLNTTSDFIKYARQFLEYGKEIKYNHNKYNQLYSLFSSQDDKYNKLVKRLEKAQSIKDNIINTLLWTGGAIGGLTGSAALLSAYGRERDKHKLANTQENVASKNNMTHHNGGKDNHKYYDYIITQSMLGNPTAKRMTGEDDRYIPAFGQGDRSNLVIGSYGNYSTPSVMDVGGELMYVPNPWEVFPEWMVQNQSFRFNNPIDAIDFAENYKYSSPAFPEFFGVDNSVNYKHGKDSGIHIKKKNRGKFTAAAKRAGMGVQAYARKILNAPKGKYSSTLRKRANFAANAAKWAK